MTRAEAMTAWTAAGHEARTGVLERAGRAVLVEYLYCRGERYGHMREVDFGAEHGKRWRWLVYLVDGDCVGDEATRELALLMAWRFQAEMRWAQQQRAAPRASVRQVGPSSRRPGAGPTVGVVYADRELPASVLAEIRRPHCPHGLFAGHCDACGADFCSHPGALAHACAPLEATP